MSRIFVSHSSSNNAEAAALAHWLAGQGWKDDLFIDFDPDRGIAAGARWERALYDAANRCEAVVFLISKEWLASLWCAKELSLAYKLNKRLFGLLIDDIKPGDLPRELTERWQVVSLVSGADHVTLTVTMPVTHEQRSVNFSQEGLARLKRGLRASGLDPRYFVWPPESDLDRFPYRGLRPFDETDAGIFFGREGAIVDGLDTLRGLCEAPPPRMLTILGASGAGKSSFLRAGLLPRLKRDDRNFRIFAPIRPERAVITGAHGLAASMHQAVTHLGVTRVEVDASISAGAASVQAMLARLLDDKAGGDETCAAPCFVLAIDQAEELFGAEGQAEAQAFFTLLHDLLVIEAPRILVLSTIRSDSFDRLQSVEQLSAVKQRTLSLAPMAFGAFSEVIRGPARRYVESGKPLAIDDRLVDALLADLSADDAKDALPLLSFTLERLFIEGGARGKLTLEDYDTLGRIRGSIDAAVSNALNAAGATTLSARAQRLQLLRAGFVPWLASIDAATSLAKRAVASVSDIPAEARAIIALLVEQRLLSTDRNDITGEVTVEVAHEALLRQWTALSSWLDEEREFLAWRDDVEQTAQSWAAARKRGDRASAAEALLSGRALGLSQFWFTSERRKLSRSAKRFINLAKSRGRLYFTAALCVIYLVGLAALTAFFGELYERARPTPPFLLFEPDSKFAIAQVSPWFRTLAFALFSGVHVMLAAIFFFKALRPVVWRGFSIPVSATASFFLASALAALGIIAFYA